MARENKSKNGKKLKEDEEDRPPLLHPDTHKSVWALVFLGVAIILLLAGLHNAGPAGEFIYRIFEGLFGWAYYLLPGTFLVMAGVFLFSGRQKLYKITAIGAGLFLIASLGLIDILAPEQAGLMGQGIGLIEVPFGYTASMVIMMVMVVAGLLITFNMPLNLRAMLPKKKEKHEEQEEKAPKIMPQVAAPTAPVIEKEKEEDKEEEKDEEVEVAEGKQPPRLTARTKLTFKNYVAPPADLLKSSVEKPTSGDLRANANIIKRTLESFGIPVEMAEINIGPKITRYTLKPAEGVKLSRIVALNQDLALALAAHPIRIEAPVPGKSLVGIEVPNKAAAIVRLGSLMGYPEFTNSGPLTVTLGRDVTGDPITMNIEKLPHLLVGGTTGSGKSIVLHALLVSLLYKNSPETLQLVLIDPKKVELSIYDNLPHLISPVIKDTKKAARALQWMIKEMERRYEVLLEDKSRDIQSYNKKNANNVMPFLIIVIDELADLMMGHGREIEGSIVRLAQMARATGIHLIVSTQRPSTEVVTGLIKANITSRIALQLPSQIDSRTILDTAGAEKLLGGGDMLFISNEFSKPKRIQGAYISEEEVNKVADFIRDNNKAVETEEAVPEEEKEDVVSDIGNFLEGKDGEEDGDDDELLDEAIKVVVEAGKASSSLLQRRLKVGYARGARLIDIMERKGIIGKGDGAKPREVFLETSDARFETKEEDFA